MSEIRNLTRNGETFYPLTCTEGLVNRDGNVVGEINDIFDISEYNASGTPPVLAKYNTLSLALAAVPTSKQKGGMTVRYVQTSDNKYVQYRLMAQNFSADEADWQGVDDEPIAGSRNLVKSGGVFSDVYPYYNKFICDHINDFSVKGKEGVNGNVFESNDISFVSTTNAWQSLVYELRDIKEGVKLYFKVNRNGQASKLRILCYDTVDTSHIVADTSQVDADTVSLLVPVGTKYIRVVIYIALGSAITGGVTYTFDNYRIYYEGFYDKAYLSQNGSISIDFDNQQLIIGSGSIRVSKTKVVELQSAITLQMQQGSGQSLIFNVVTNTFSIKQWNYVLQENELFVGIIFVDWTKKIATSDELDIKYDERVSLLDNFKTSNLTAEISTDNIIGYSDYNRIIACDNIKLISGSAAWQNVYYDIYNPLVGQMLYFKVGLGGQTARIRIICYDDYNDVSSAHIVADSGYQSVGYSSVIVPLTTKKIRCLIYIAFGTAITSGTEFNFTDYEIGYNTGKLNGNYVYYGDTPINVRPANNNMYNKTTLLSKNYDSSAVDIDYRRQQAMALYDNYLFCFEDRSNNVGHCQIFEFDSLRSNPDPICSMLIECQHANSAEFTNVFYNDGDEFPLLLISYFYSNKAGLFRIVRSDNNFSATLIKEIVLSGEKFAMAIEYGSTFTVNYITNMLYVFIPQESWDAHLYKPILAYSFQLGDILTDGDIVLTENDIKQSYAIPWFVVQSMIVANGLIYAPTQLNVPFMGYTTGHSMLVINPDGFVVKNIVPLNKQMEEEGIVISGNDIYISFRISNATQDNLAFAIDKYTFV